MPILQCHGLRKQFGGLSAIDGIDFSIEAGEIVGLIGPNGAGKTTFVNLLTGEIAPTSGRITYREQDITHLQPYQRSRLGLARTFQIPRPFGSMSLRENVFVAALFGSSQRPKDHAYAKAKASEVLEITGLRDFTEQHPNTLSTAGLKRLEVARCLASDPEILFLDEPLGGLNPTETQDAIALIQSLSRKGITIVFIEHIIKAVTAVSHRVFVLTNGRKLAEGSPQEIVANESVKRAYLGDIDAAVERSRAHRAARLALANSVGRTR